MAGVDELANHVGPAEVPGQTRKVHSQEARESLMNIARGVLAVRPLIDALPHPVSVVLGAGGNHVAQAPRQEQTLLRLEGFLNRVAARIGAPQFKVCSDVFSPRQSVFELAVSRRLTGEQFGFDEDGLLEMDAAGEIIDEAVVQSFDQKFFRARLESFDGVWLRAYTAGDHEKKAVVLISACGMPAKLCEQWIQLLGKDYYVITWESRLLFEELASRESFAFDVNAQVSDLFAVMDHFGVITAHVMGLCGGAVIALSAAVARPERVSSLSLWHGDYEVGPACAKTRHQQDMKAFMLTAAMGRAEAEQIHKLFSHNTRKNFQSHLAHLVLYPYANAELLYRYGKSNGSIMGTDVTPLLAKVEQPTLVVTSSDDGTAHPEGSKRVAETLPDAQLRVIAHGDHLSLFNAAPDVTEIAMRFLALGC